MRIGKLLLVCVCLVGLTQLVWSQDSSVLKAGERGIPGFLNPKTGTFTAKVQRPEATAPAVTSTVYYGTYQVYIHLTVSSDIPSNAVITCSAHLYVSDYGSNPPNGSYDEDGGVVVANRSGTTASCLVPIDYSWSLSNGSTDTFTVSYDIYALVNVPVGSTNNVVSARHSGFTWGTTPKIPTSASTTTATFDATF